MGRVEILGGKTVFFSTRDGILAAVPTAAQDCIVWNAFSQFGIGQGADGRVTCYFGVFCSKPVITESFTKPASCL